MTSRDFAFGAPTLNDFTIALAGVGAIEDVAAVVLGLGADVVGATSAHLSIVVQPGWRRDYARVSSDRRIDGGLIDRPIAIDTPLSRALVTQQPQVFESRDEYRANFPHLAHELDTVSANTAITLPMRRNDGVVVGAITFAFSDLGPMPPGRRSLAAHLAEQSASALERALLLYREREAAKRALRLQSAATRLAGVSTVDALLAVLHEACHESLNATDATIYELVDDELMRPLVLSSDNRDDVIRERLPREVLVSERSPVGDAVLLDEIVSLENPSQTRLRYRDTVWTATEALLAVPLRVGIETVGALCLTFGSARRFLPDDVAMARTLAEQVSLALERCRLREQAALQTRLAERERDHLSAITAALQDGLFATDPTGRIIDVNDRFCEITGYSRDQILQQAPPYPWWPRSDPEATQRFLTAMSERILSAPRGGSEFDVTLQRPDGHRTLGLLTAAPLHDGDGKVTGVVGTVKDVTARVLAERRLRVLQAVTTGLAASQTLDDVARATTDEAVRTLRAAAGAFFMIADDSDGAPNGALPTLIHVRELLHNSALPWRQFGVDADSNAKRCFETAEVSITADTTTRAIAIPVRPNDGDHPVACLSLLFRDDRPPSTEDLALYVSISQQCGQALSRALANGAEHRARIAAEHSTERLRQLQEATAALTVASVPNEVARATAQQIANMFGAASVGLYSVDHETESLVLENTDDSMLSELGPRVRNIPLDSELSVAASARTQKPVWIHNREQWAATFPRGFSIFGDRFAALVVLPLVVDGDSLGALSMTFDHDLLLSDADRTMLLTLADLATQAMHRAARFAAERTVATTLQRSLLPRQIHSTDRCRIAVRYQPALDDLQVGGDWFDTFTDEHDRLAVTVGDVVGRGLSAAACMGQLRSAIGVLALGGGGPAEVLDQIDGFAERTEGGESSTVAFAVIDLVTGVMRYACAGHPPPLLISPEGQTEFLYGGRSWPLGIGYTHRRRSEDSVRLRPGTSVVFYTDGLVERRDASLDERLEQLAATAAAGPIHDPEALTDHLLGALLDDALRDDVAVLTLRFDPAMADHVRWQFPSSPTWVPDARGVTRRWLSRSGIVGDQAFDIVVACDEACTNAVEHGGTDVSTEVDLDLHLDDEASGSGVLVTVTDRGNWRAPTPDDDPGHGLALMEALMLSVRFEYGTDGTTVYLRSG